jgi:hypothetical protein
VLIQRFLGPADLIDPPSEPGRPFTP